MDVSTILEVKDKMTEEECNAVHEDEVLEIHFESPIAHVDFNMFMSNYPNSFEDAGYALTQSGVVQPWEEGYYACVEIDWNYLCLKKYNSISICYYMAWSPVSQLTNLINFIQDVINHFGGTIKHRGLELSLNDLEHTFNKYINEIIEVLELHPGDVEMYRLTLSREYYDARDKKKLKEDDYKF